MRVLVDGGQQLVELRYLRKIRMSSVPKVISLKPVHLCMDSISWLS